MLLRVTPGFAQELCNNHASSGPPSTQFGTRALKLYAPRPLAAVRPVLTLSQQRREGDDSRGRAAGRVL